MPSNPRVFRPFPARGQPRDRLGALAVESAGCFLLTSHHQPGALGVTFLLRGVSRAFGVFPPHKAPRNQGSSQGGCPSAGRHLRREAGRGGAGESLAVPGQPGWRWWHHRGSEACWPGCGCGARRAPVEARPGGSSLSNLPLAGMCTYSFNPFIWVRRRPRVLVWILRAPWGDPWTEFRGLVNLREVTLHFH